MTHNLEAYIEAALIMFIAVCWGALILIFKKIFQGRLGFRRQDRFYSLLDDVNERLAFAEMTLEQLRPKTQTGDLGRPGPAGQLSKFINLVEKNAEGMTQTAFDNIRKGIKEMDIDPDQADFDAGRPVHGFK